MAFLHIINSHDEGDQRMTAFADGAPMFVGRLPACDIALFSPDISRRHAVLIEKNGSFGIKDLGSANGTFVNGERLAGSYRIKDGDVIQIGEFILKIIREDAPSAGPGQTPPVAPPARSGQKKTPTPGVAFIAPSSGGNAPAGEERPEAAEAAPSGGDGRPIPVSAAEPGPKPETAFPGETAPPETAGPARSGTDAPRAAASRPEAEPAAEPRPGAAERGPAPDDEKPDLPPAEAGGQGAADRESPAAPVPGPGPEPRARPARRTAAVNADLYEPDSAFAEKGGEEDDGGLSDGADEKAEEKAAAAVKAAAEAGLVGEFAPDVEEAAGGVQAREEASVDKIPLPAGFRQAIENRLILYSFLDDLVKERQDFLARLPQMPDAVKAELARQDRELVKMPGAALAREMIERREARRQALREKIEEAKKNETPPPKRPPQSMREAEELAETQWHFFIQSEEEALPAVLDQAYAIVGDEPLAEALAAKGIAAKQLLGGGAYLLALESLLDEATRARHDAQAALAAAAKHRNKSSFRLFGHNNDDDEDDEENGEDDGQAAPSPEGLAEREQKLASRVGWLNKEMAEVEKTLLAEFWRVYTEAALGYLPDPAAMPLPVRCFLRHGAIGFKPWWMKEDVRDHLFADCRDNYRDRAAREAADTCIIYADEYLEAVLGGECTPALDENLELNERNSPAWKADKALRRLVYSRKQETRLNGLLGTIQKHVDRLREEMESFDAKLAKILPGSRNEKQNRRELQQQQQGVRVEMTKAAKVRDKIRNETLAAITETVADTDARFASGELSRPGTEFLVRRECDAIHRIARLLANLKERFLPLVVRDYKLGTDAMNDRESVAAEIAFMEKRDPAVFLETVIPSKKRKDRLDLRVPPTIVIVPTPGLLCYAWNPRGGQENGRLAIPSCFIRQRLRERQITYLFSDFRWDTAKVAAGLDVMKSDTIVAAFMAVRWDWSKRSREAREKGLIFSEQNDRTNWRRVYETYMQSALDGGRKLYNRNYDFYERIVGKYFYLPEGVELLKK